MAEADLRGGRLGGQPGGQLWDTRPGCGGTSSAPPCPSFLSLISSHWALRGLVLVSAGVVTSRPILLAVPQNRAWVPASPSASCPRPGLLEGLLRARAALGIGMYCEQARPVIRWSSSGQVLQGEGWGAEQACERGVWASLGVREALLRRCQSRHDPNRSFLGREGNSHQRGQRSRTEASVATSQCGENGSASQGS